MRPSQRPAAHEWQSLGPVPRQCRGSGRPRESPRECPASPQQDAFVTPTRRVYGGPRCPSVSAGKREMSPRARLLMKRRRGCRLPLARTSWML